MKSPNWVSFLGMLFLAAATAGNFGCGSSQAMSGTVVVHANNVVVSCPGQSLSAAVAALPPGPNTVTVTGTCINESVVINNMRSLSIIAGAAGAKIVQAQDSDTFDIFLSP